MSYTNRFGKPDWPRFLKYVEKREDGCWWWIGARRGNGRNEYGAFWAQGTQRAHIVSYVWTYGEPNADLHHICGNPLCVNPEHITPAAAGQRRHRNPIPSLCAQGHEFTPENTAYDKNGWRRCKACARERTRRHREANHEAVLARRRELRERIVYDERPCQHCGLPFTPERSTGRMCRRRECINSRQRANRQRRLGL